MRDNHKDLGQENANSGRYPVVSTAFLVCIFHDTLEQRCLSNSSFAYGQEASGTRRPSFDDPFGEAPRSNPSALCVKAASVENAVDSEHSLKSENARVEDIHRG